jgi:thymidylate synthase
MILIHSRTIGEAHEEVIRIIHERCKESVRVTEDQEITYDPEEPICIHIDKPLQEPMRSSASLFGAGFSEMYQSSLYTITKRKNDGTDAVYTYGNRLRDYLRPELQIRSPKKRLLDGLFSRIGYVPAESQGTLTYLGDGNEGGIDQIQRSIIDRLIENPTSRRAVAITWVPDMDINRDEPPCLQIVQCLIDTGKHLNLVCLFRSNDMLSAWGQNAYGLTHLQKYILDHINEGRTRNEEEPLMQGWLETISNSAHMYFKRDQLELIQFLEKNKAKDAFSSFHRT